MRLMEMRNILVILMAGLFGIYFSAETSSAQTITPKDSIQYRITYRDTIIYKYDTVNVKYYVATDTLWGSSAKSSTGKVRKYRLFNPNSWGIGPSVGTYYSFFNGFDVNIGFGIQYYLFAVPSFRTPHLRNKRERIKKS